MKADWNNFITQFRRQFGPVKYWWFLEFQERGAPHYHVGLNIGPPLAADRQVMAEIWCRIAERYTWLYCPLPTKKRPKKWFDGIWTRDTVRAVHEFPTSWESFRSDDGPLRYVVSYATKPHQKTVPAAYRNVGRFWSVVDGHKMEPGLTLGGSEQDVRELAKELGRNFDNWIVLPRVIFF